MTSPAVSVNTPPPKGGFFFFFFFFFKVFSKYFTPPLKGSFTLSITILYPATQGGIYQGYKVLISGIRIFFFFFPCESFFEVFYSTTQGEFHAEYHYSVPHHSRGDLPRIQSADIRISIQKFAENQRNL